MNEVLKDYFESVLGVTAVARPVAPVQEESSWLVWGDGESAVAFVSIADDLREKKAWELFGKMSAAMKLNGMILAQGEDLNQLPALNSEILVLFISEKNELPFGEFFELEGKRAIATYHPSRLLSRPQDKKEVWGHLQMVMREINVEAH